MGIMTIDWLSKIETWLISVRFLMFLIVLIGGCHDDEEGQY